MSDFIAKISGNNWILSSEIGLSLAVTLIIALVLLYGNFALFYIANAVRFISKLITGGLRTLRLLPRSHRETSTARRSGIGPFAIFAQALRRRTLVDLELRALADENGKFVHIERSGIFFRSVRPDDNCYPPTTVTDEEAKVLLGHAERLFGFNVPIKEILKTDQYEYRHEDVAGSLTIRLFRGDDRHDDGHGEDLERGPDDIYYSVMDTMRKIINRNVRIFSILLMLGISLFLIANVAYHKHKPLIDNYFSQIFRDDIDPLQFATITIFITVLWTGLLAFLYRIPQTWNGQQIDHFTRDYLQVLKNRFTQTQLKASNAIFSDDPQMCNVWIANNQWLAWRVFFLEVYLRDILYQTIRNSSNYMLIAPLILFAPICILLPEKTKRLYEYDSATLVYVFSILIFFIIYLFMMWSALNALKQTMREQTWSTFHTLRSDWAIGEIVNQFFEEIKRWRSAFGGGGSAPPPQ